MGTPAQTLTQPLLKRGDKSAAVRQLQQLLTQRGYLLDPDGKFAGKTFQAVRAFQASHVDAEGHPLVVDGKVGPLTWWALTHPSANAAPSAVVDFVQMPPPEAGGSRLGRAALQAAIGELKAGAGEVGGNNSGPFVLKYLQPAGMPEGEAWCASFASWCYLQAAGTRTNMPFAYCPGARKLLQEFKDKGWAHAPGDSYQPLPGDLVFWWRVRADGWQGHVGFVYQLLDGRLYTVEGNKTPNVQGFSYVFTRMSQLLGYGHVPD
ncbi:MAG TPA: peptidoglycan-binding protein [Terriglobales bacterium]|nr:peptidoglycan-binding protein [Terriglobales bacterium]